MEKSDKFNFNDFIQLCELINSLRKSTIPANEHVDALGLNNSWEDVSSLLMKMGYCFKEQMIDKESLEDMSGKIIHSFEKVYDENGVMTGVKIIPVSALNYIKINLSPETRNGKHNN